MSDNENGNNMDSFEQALMDKRDSIVEQISSIDSLVTKVQEEFAKKIEELESSKTTHEESLKHIEALLEKDLIFNK